MKNIIKEVVSNNNLIHIATIDLEGNPANRGVDYAMGDTENVVYFITHKATSKVDQIKNNSKVSFVIDKDCKDWAELSELRYIKGSGNAYIIEDAEEAQKAIGYIFQKFPFLKYLPGEPTDFIPVKVVFDKVFVTDNTISFGHTEMVDYSASK